MPKYRISYGLALCRKNSNKNNNIEILSIQKRYSYHFANFVSGFYKKNNDFNYIKYLFDNMTFQEKLCILSYNYSNMWWHLWLTNPEKGIGNLDNSIYKIYFKKKTKFDKSFLSDGGKKLKYLINNSKNCELMWEIPKGSSLNNEKELDTAIREFTEETNFHSSWYNILYHIEPVIVSYKDNGIIYKHIYYLAILNSNDYKAINPKLNFNSIQINEISNIGWMGLDNIKYLNINKKNKKYMLNLYKKIIDKFKKEIK
jgi:8-oxo-dGTP pyrophosphatase MutT (NUDIX family)